MPISPEELQGVPRINVIVDCHLPHAEVFDIKAGQAWHSVHPIEPAEYEDLELPEGLVKVGLGIAVPDAHYFRRPPTADVDGPVESREIAGRLFIQNANQPLSPPEALGDQWPLIIQAVKHHSLVFEAGREIEVIRVADGRDYVSLIAPAPDGGALFQNGEVPDDPDHLDLLPGWTLRTETISQRLVIDLPYPTEALFFANGASYQGPVTMF